MLPRGVRRGGRTGGGGAEAGWRLDGWRVWDSTFIGHYKKNNKGQDQPSTSFESVSRFK